MDAPLALYRRYRPGTFAEVVGQDQVTVPLSRALDANRVNHAYLFSGPRGCGKTTSARILARSLNCEHGPTSTPCGVCRSCRDLAPGGPGSVDVVEIDAASHGGVDDARDLRERAFFSPVASRYKVYVVDEAHMVSSAGFNALLKLVEEPPEHLKFVFATTEPEKVIGTIRSRTHHYPFRLIPPRTMAAHLAGIAERDGVTVAPAVLPLVVRAGGGSARDALSVLDQLIGGAGTAGVTYEDAIALLGYTSDALLDRVVDALAAYDGREVFAAVEQVIEAGQDPRRFVEDLLRRMRDLVVLGLVPEGGRAELLDVPPETVDALARQAAAVGQAAALRAAELLDAGVTEIRGATAPRLHLELLLARLLLPAAADGEAGFAARLERVERRLAGPVPQPGPAVGAVGSTHGPGSGPATNLIERAADSASASAADSASEAAHYSATSQATDPATDRIPASDAAGDDSPAGAQPGTAEPSPRAELSVRPGQVTLADLRRLWPEVLESLRLTSRVTWMSLEGSQIVGLEQDLLTVAVSSEGVRTNFARNGRDAVVREALRALLALDVRVDVVVGSFGPPAAKPRASRSAPPRDTAPVAERGPDPVPGAVAASQLSPQGPEAVSWPAAAVPGGGPATTGAGSAGLSNSGPSGPSGPGPAAGADPAGDVGPRAAEGVRSGVAQRLREQAAAVGSPDDAVSPDDADLDGPGMTGTALLTRELGAEVIEDHPNLG